MKNKNYNEGIIINPSFEIGEIVVSVILELKGIVRYYEVYNNKQVFYVVMLQNGELITFMDKELMSKDDFEAYQIIKGDRE